MNITSTVGTLVGELRESVSRQGLSDRKDISQLVMSRESMDDASRASAVTAQHTLDDVVQNSIDMILSRESEGMKFTAAQREAAVKIAGLAIDPVAGMSAISESKAPAGMNGALSVEASSLGITDIVGDGQLSTESFDSQSMNNAVYFSVAYNLFAARQDTFGETFFPTITIDPASSGIAIGTDVTSIYSEVVRTTDGAPNRKRFNKVTLAKAIYDNNLLGGDRNKVVPVSRAANAAMLLPALSRVDQSSGEAITTAPLVVGKEINLLGISQTDAMLAKGTMDAYDTLDRTINVSSIIVSLTANVTPPAVGGAAPGAPVATTEHFRVPVGMLPHSNFAYTAQGHEKDLSLAFDSTDVAFLTSATTTYNGAASAILATLPVGHRVKLHIKLNGDGNTQYGDVAVYASVIEIDSIFDAAGNLLPATNVDYTAISTAFASLAVEGYEVEAYLTNSNLRKQGQLVTIDRYEQVYNVPVRSGVSVVMPVNSSGNDDSRLVGQVQTTGYRMNLAAVDTLVTFSNNLNTLTSNGANADIAVMGVGRHHVDAYYSEANLDLSVIVDSESSANRGSDIRAALIARIRDEVYRAYITSKYSVAHAMIRGSADVPVGVIIGTSPRIKNYLTSSDGNMVSETASTIDLGAGFVAKVVDTPNATIGDSMFITFSNHMASDRNSKVDPISFGQCLWAPTINTDVSTTVNGAVTRRFQTHPRFAHIVNLPIMMRLNVTNVTGVLGKVARYQHVV